MRWPDKLGDQTRPAVGSDDETTPEKGERDMTWDASEQQSESETAKAEQTLPDAAQSGASSWSQARRPVLVCIAWPYVNAEQHIGHYAGCHLPADIFARFQRLAGQEVLMVSGSDAHGTPITVRAREEGIEPAEVVRRYHAACLKAHQAMGISLDLYTQTHTSNHVRVAQDMFTGLLEKGYIYKATSQQLYDRQAACFLPDRYVEGTCPKCGAAQARGDQCDACGATYEAVELINPVSKVSGSSDLEVRDTEHFYLDLSKMNAALHDWIQQDRRHWRPSVLNFSRAEIGKMNLKGRPITRDLSWGVPIPLEGFDDKRLYVWFEAVIGYLSASQEWAQRQGQPEAWQRWWQQGGGDEQARAYYFLGKDNISFHTLLWPAMLMAKGGLNLPFDVPANEYLNSYGRKFSKSRGNAIPMVAACERFQPDAWRYVLTALAPETGDVNFSWDDFVEKVNNELVANWGNLVHRVSSLAFKHFSGVIPEAPPLNEDDSRLLEQLKQDFESVGELFQAVKLRAALEEVRSACQKVNQYLNQGEPWRLIKSDPEAGRRMMYVALQAVDWLKLMWAPILPHTSQQLHHALGYEGRLFGEISTHDVQDELGQRQVLTYEPVKQTALGGLALSPLPAGQVLHKPKPLFTKLEADEVFAFAEAYAPDAAKAKA